MKTKGRIHSFEMGSSVDGPGLRFVIFTQGCALRCLYCHNPDTRDPHGGQEVSVAEMLAEIEKYLPYLEASGGGVTISGGEPTLQPEFVASIFQGCKERGIPTALDTSGFCSQESAALILPQTDLVLLDIKSWEPELYRKLTHVELEPTLRLARYLSAIGKHFWLRFVLVPGLTDSRENVEGLARFCAGLKSLERVEILPFHKLGEYKWKELGYEYSLSEARPPSPEEVQEVIEVFRKNVSCPVLA